MGPVCFQQVLCQVAATFILSRGLFIGKYVVSDVSATITASRDKVTDALSRYTI